MENNKIRREKEKNKKRKINEINNNSNNNNRKDKKEQILIDRLINKITNKINEKIRKEKKNIQNIKISEETFILSKIAYDAARSGTEEQINEINKVISFIINPLNQNDVINISKNQCIEHVLKLSESALFMALSGIKSNYVYEILVQNITLLLSNLQYDTIDDIEKIIESFEYLAVAGIKSNISNINSGFYPLVPIINSIVNTLKKQSKKRILPLKNILNDMKTLKLHSPSSSSISTSISTSTLLSHQNSTNQFSFGYWLHSPSGGPLMALWKHSTKQKKVRCLIDDNMNLPPGTRRAKLVKNINNNSTKQSRVIWSGDSPLGFNDMNLPLVVDIGCGFGVSLLGIASIAENYFQNNVENSIIKNWNCIGCDLSSHCISYAQSISTRWNISHRCRFCVAPAEDFVEWIKDHYPGPIVWVLIQFPTPYVLQMKSNNLNRNSQLPTFQISPFEQNMNVENSLEENNNIDGGFMVTNRLIELIINMKIIKSNSSSPSPSSLSLRLDSQDEFHLYVQSNVEDVAVTMKNKIEEKIRLNSTSNLSFNYLTEYQSELNIIDEEQEGIKKRESRYLNLNDEVKTKRQELWEASGGERIEIGQNEWLQSSPLPIYCRTETEAAYAIMKKPVYRIGWNL